MNKIFLFGLLINAFAHATGTMCTVKRDASYAGFTQCSNDIHAYKMFFSKTFSECASATYDFQPPDNKCDIKTACRLKRKSAYSTFTYFSNDMKLFEDIFQEKHPECGENDDVHDPFDNQLTTDAYNKKKICKLAHEISYVASTYYSNNTTKYENMFMEKFPGCLNTDADDSNLTTSVANANIQILNCAHKRLIYEKKKQEGRGVATNSQGMIRHKRPTLKTKTFYDEYPECKPKKYIDLGLIQSSSNEVVKRRRLVQRYSLCNIG